jgi:hypothetical protein
LRSVPMVLLQTEGALTASGGKQLFFWVFIFYFS